MTTRAVYDYRVKNEIAKLKWAVWAKKVVEAGYFDPAMLDMKGSPGFMGRGTFTADGRSDGYRRSR